MLIRSATAADLPAVRSIAHATWPVAYASILSPAQLTYMLERMYSEAALNEQFRCGHRFLLAERYGTPIGFGGYAHGHTPGRTRLHKLYVLPEAQGSGTGHALLMEVIRLARVVGDTMVELNVNRHNPALLWYQAHGFTIARDEVIDIGQGFVMDDHVLERHVQVS